MPVQKEKNLQTNPLQSPGFLVIFLVGLFIRFFGATKINFIESEAAYVLELAEFISFTPSILQNLANKFALHLPDYSPLTFRLISIFAGSFIVLLPYFLRQEIGYKSALVCAFFLAIDPFLIADSILITGNTFVLLAAGLLIVAWLDERYELVSALLILMVMMGRGFAYFFIAINVFLLITSSYPRFLAGFKSGFSKLKSILGHPHKLVTVGLILIIIFFISSTHINIFTADLSNFVMNIRTDYPPGYSPFLYPLALLFYVPLGLVMAILALFSRKNPLERVLRIVIICSGLFLVLITLFPGHRVVDLVWVSTPIWAVSAIGIAHFYDQIRSKLKNNLVFIALLLVGMGNLILGFLSLSYRTRFGLALVENLVAIFTITVFVITLVIYWAYIRDIKTAFGGLGVALFILFLLFQISFTSHTAGFSGYPEREIFWDGYFPDKSLIDKLIETSIGNQLGTMARTRIWVDREINPEVYWDLGSNQFTKQIEKEDPDPDPDNLVIFRADEKTINLSAPYLGQKFVAKSYPAWMTTPLRSLMTDDFWSWVLIRDSQQYQAYNYLWLRAEN